MGLFPYLHERHAWDRSHRSLKLKHGTSFLKAIIIVLWSPKYENNFLWDQSHTYLSYMYGNGSMFHGGLQNKEITKLQQKLSIKAVPFVILRKLWDWSHTCISGIYGTGPMHVCHVCMGPNPWELFNRRSLFNMYCCLWCVVVVVVVVCH